MTSHWGDLPVIVDTDSGIAAIEREQMTKPRAMEVEGPRLHQPSSRHYPPSNDSLSPEHFAVDPVTVHTIQLLQHSKKLRQLINTAQQHIDANKNSDTEVSFVSLQSPPRMPCYDGPEMKKIGRPFPFIPKELQGKFQNGKGMPPPEIDDITTRRLLKRSVGALLAHVGFDTCSESALDTLTDIGHEYILHMCGLLRRAVNNSSQFGQTNYQDVFQQVFMEMGIGNVTTLHDYYQHRVLNYHQNMLETCQLLEEEYEQLRKPDIKLTEEYKNIKIKEEPLSDINFPVSDETADDTGSADILDLQGLSGLEMPVDHEQSASLHHEEDSKWLANVKTELPEAKVNILDTLIDDHQGLSPGPCLEGDVDDCIQGPPSISTAEIMSPPSVTPRPPKAKRKRVQ